MDSFQGNNQNPNNLTQTDSADDTGQWVAIHNMNIIDFYSSEFDAYNGLKGYQMSKIIDINDLMTVFQIV